MANIVSELRGFWVLIPKFCHSP